MPAPYKITKYTLKKAKKLKVVVKPSTNRTKKIDVYKKGEKIASIGARGMNDFPTYIKKKVYFTQKLGGVYIKCDIRKTDTLNGRMVG